MSEDFMGNDPDCFASEIAPKVSELDQKIAELQTTSAKIRYLTSLGWKRGAIAKKLGILYQHVRNVQLQPLKKKDNA